jgi:hypothetical protein
MRFIIRFMDRLLRWVIGAFEFSDDPDCILRINVARALRTIRLSSGAEIQRGDRVVMIHLWNEHVPPIGPDGPDVVWAMSYGRRWFSSMRLLGAWLAANRPDVRAIGGVTSLIRLEGERGNLRLMQRTGFEVIPGRNLFGRFGEFWQTLYAWGLVWAFNAGSMRNKQSPRLQQIEMWVMADEFLRRHGPANPQSGG